MCRCIIVLGLLAILGAAIVVIGFVLGFVVFDQFIEDEVRERVRLKNGTPQYERWAKSEQPTIFKVYFFNVTNPYNVTNSQAKPIVEEIGPYVYRKNFTRDHRTFDEYTDVINYTRYNHFEFDIEASAPRSESEEVTILNVPLQAALQLFEMKDNITIFDEYWRDAFNITNDDEDGLFHTVTVGDYLFNGYEFCAYGANETFCDVIRESVNDSKTLTNVDNGTTFSFFHFRAFDNVGNFSIMAGNNNSDTLGKILLWNEETFLNVWEGAESTCNHIRGTDSTIFPPFNTQESTFDVFLTDVCRIFNLEYESEVEVQEINGYRYAIKDDALSSLSPDHWCHCINITRNLQGETNCLPNGFEDMYTCYGSHLVLSLPHMLWADANYTSTVEGLEPNPSLHQTYVDLEARLGTPLSIARRLQFNMIVRNNSNLTFNVEPFVIPILWFEELSEIPESLAEEIRDEFFHWLLVLEIITWVLVGVGGAIIIISLFGCLFCRK